MSQHLQGTRTVHATKSPFTETQWPLISSNLEFGLVNLLLPLISPVGHHKEKHAQSSKSKKQGKGRLQLLNTNDDGDDNDVDDEEKEGEKKEEGVVKASPQYKSDDAQHLTVGFNSTIRTLERLAKYVPSAGEPRDAESPPLSLAAVFVCAESLPNIMTSSLPLLVAIASVKSEKEIRLVKISAKSAKKIANALGLPRVNALGISANVTGAEPLMALLTEIDLVNVPYLSQAVSGVYRPVRIHSETVLPISKEKPLKRTRVMKRMHTVPNRLN